VRLIGSETLSASYARALAAQGVVAEPLPAAECTLAGLAVASGKAKA
jgi:2-keto-3-deoxy-galactonokinase